MRRRLFVGLAFAVMAPLLGVRTLTAQAAREGIAVHGHWVIDVKNPDGTVAKHVEFENGLTDYGRGTLVGLLTGQQLALNAGANGADSWALLLQGSGGDDSYFGNCGSDPSKATCYVLLQPHTPTTIPAAGVRAPAFPGVVGQSTNLTLTPMNFATTAYLPLQFQLSGTVQASQAVTISRVRSVSFTCFSNPSSPQAACSNWDGLDAFPLPFSSTSVSGISVQANQIIQVTVTFSFS